MTTKIQNSIDNQNKVISLLAAYGVEFQSTELTPESENIFTKCNGGDSFVLYLSNDVDIDGVFEEEKVSGISIDRTYISNGFKQPEFPIIKITC